MKLFKSRLIKLLGPLFFALALPCAQAADVRCGIDTDKSGAADVTCNATDGDADNHTTDDCDTADSFLYYPSESPNSIALYSGKGLSAGHYHKCKSDGTWDTDTDSAVTPLCEATGTGECFYLDFVSGDNNNGAGGARCSYTSPCKDFQNFGYYVSGAPAKWIALSTTDKDYIYLKNGTYTTISTIGGSWDTATAVIACRGSAANYNVAIKAYPGQSPIVKPTSGPVVFNEGCDNWFIGDGIDFDGSGGGTRGLSFDTSSDGADGTELRNFWVHGFDGSYTTNDSGLYFAGANNTKTHHVILYDNYDAASAPNENSSNVVYFRGDGNSFNDSASYYTLANKGTCIKYKHAECASNGSQCRATVTVSRNILSKCYLGGYRGGQPILNFSNNYVSDSDAGVAIATGGGIGGPAFGSGDLIDHNTFNNTPPLDYDVDLAYMLAVLGTPASPAADACSGNSPIGTLVFSNNVAAGTWTGNAIDVHKFGPNTIYTNVVTGGKLSFSNNCYSSTPTFAAETFGTNSGGAACTTSGTLGDTYATYAAWTAAGYDSGSANPSVTVNSSGQLTAGAGCAVGVGWSADTTTTTNTTTTTAATTSTTTPSGAQTRGRFRGRK